MRTPRPSGFLAAVAALLLVLATGCSATQPSAAAGGATGDGWSFTDDLGATVTLGSRPDKVAGLSDVVYSLMNYGLRPVASFGYSDLATDPRFADLDTRGVVELGTTYGEIDIEALATAAPVVIVTFLVIALQLAPARPMDALRVRFERLHPVAVAPAADLDHVPEQGRVEGRELDAARVDAVELPSGTR